MKYTLSLLFILAISACTAVKVIPLDSSYNVSHICIEKNPRVIVKGFVGVIQNAFQDHGISSEIYEGSLPSHCDYKLTYTATRDWDVTAFLSNAELRLFKGIQRIALAKYRLKGAGGLSLTKWASTESKMKPLVQQLLAQHPKN